jgi:hypothetical protein
LFGVRIVLDANGLRTTLRRASTVRTETAVQKAMLLRLRSRDGLERIEVSDTATVEGLKQVRLPHRVLQVTGARQMTHSLT